jgi:hypothetical protein
VKALVFATVASIALMLPGCSLFKSSTGSTVINDVGGLAACVIQHVEQDPDPTFEGIAAECVGVAVSDVVTIVAALQPTVDGGSGAAPSTKAALVHHK